MKRFWSDVTVDDGAVFLDGRPLRTPGRAALQIASPLLAAAIADEWRAVDGDIDPRAMPLTGLVNAAIDRIAPDPVAFAAGLARYGETDLLCYRADAPQPLIARQAAAWDPLLAWAQQRYDVHFVVTTGIIHRPQPEATVKALAAAVAACRPLELAALTPIVTVTGSLIVALALLEGVIDGDRGWQAARIDDDWQAEQWGEDDLATRTATAHRADYDAGVRLLALIAAPDGDYSPG